MKFNARIGFEALAWHIKNNSILMSSCRQLRDSVVVLQMIRHTDARRLSAHLTIAVRGLRNGAVWSSFLVLNLMMRICSNNIIILKKIWNTRKGTLPAPQPMVIFSQKVNVDSLLTPNEKMSKRKAGNQIPTSSPLFIAVGTASMKKMILPPYNF